jgi:glycosyltransferase involved in cell wall biosynthesis
MAELGQVATAIVPYRSAHANHHDIGVGAGAVRDREPTLAKGLVKAFLKPRFVDGYDPGLESLEPVWADLNKFYVVAERREPHARNQAHVTRAYDDHSPRLRHPSRVAAAPHRAAAPLSGQAGNNLSVTRDAQRPRSRQPRRPRVVMLVENLAVPFDRRTWQEATALHGDGWDVTVIGPRGSGDSRRLRDRIDGIEVLRYPQWPAKGLRGYLAEYVPSLLFTAAWFLFARVRGPIDVVHACNPPDLFWPFGLIARMWRGRFVFDEHDANPELAETKWGSRRWIGPWLIGATSWLERRSYGVSALVLAPNDSYRQLALGRGGLKPERVVVVRNAPDVGTYRALSGTIQPEPKRVGYVGVMGSQDGLDVLIEAWRLVLLEPDMPDARLELVGDGEARPALEALVVREGLEKSVTFHGYQKPAEFVPLLAACTVCVCPDPPTPFNDVSTMVKVVDYLAIGRGIVAFDLHETRLVAGDAALLVEPSSRALADGLLSVLRDDLLSRRMNGATGIRLDALAIDWRYSAEVLTHAYRSLLRPD